MAAEPGEPEDHGVTPVLDVDGRLAQGWGGTKPDGIHVNVGLARRGSATAAAFLGAFACPAPGRTPILVSVGEDQPSYQTLYPPTVMLSKSPPADERHETLLFGAVQVGIARAVLDCAADGLLEADQDTLVFVSVWLEPTAESEPAVRDAARQATRNAITEALRGRPSEDVRRLIDAREQVTHPFYAAGPS